MTVEGGSASHPDIKPRLLTEKNTALSSPLRLRNRSEVASEVGGSIQSVACLVESRVPLEEGKGTGVAGERERSLHEQALPTRRLRLEGTRQLRFPLLCAEHELAWSSGHLPVGPLGQPRHLRLRRRFHGFPSPAAA